MLSERDRTSRCQTEKIYKKSNNMCSIWSFLHSSRHCRFKLFVLIINLSEMGQSNGPSFHFWSILKSWNPSVSISVPKIHIWHLNAFFSTMLWEHFWIYGSHPVRPFYTILEKTENSEKYYFIFSGNIACKTNKIHANLP